MNTVANKAKKAESPAAPTPDTKTVTTGRLPWAGCLFGCGEVHYNPASQTADGALSAHYNAKHAAEALALGSA